MIQARFYAKNAASIKGLNIRNVTPDIFSQHELGRYVPSLVITPLAEHSVVDDTSQVSICAISSVGIALTKHCLIDREMQMIMSFSQSVVVSRNTDTYL